MEVKNEITKATIGGKNTQVSTPDTGNSIYNEFIDIYPKIGVATTAIHLLHVFIKILK